MPKRYQFTNRKPNKTEIKKLGDLGKKTLSLLLPLKDECSRLSYNEIIIHVPIYFWL